MIAGRLSRAHYVEGVVAIVIFAIAALTAFTFLSAAEVRTFTEWESTPAAMLACGQGLRRPVETSAGLQEFEQRRRASITCDDVGKGKSIAPLAVALGERYELYGAAVAMRIGGLSWRTLDAYLAVLYGFSIACAYGICRLFAGRTAAVLGAFALCYSAAQLLGLLTLRDYGKAPSFYAVWLALGWLLQSGRRGVDRRLLGPALLLGVITGVGLGFRADILVAVPASAAVIALGLPGFQRHALKWKAAALGAYCVAFAVVSSPILWGMSGGSNNSHVIVLGLVTPFNKSLGLEPAPYDIGSTYSDGYAFTLVASHATVVSGEPQPVASATSRYDQLGAGLLGDLARQFPADVMIRTAAAIIQVLRYPFDSTHRAAELEMPYFAELTRIRSLVEMVGGALVALEGQALWLTGVVFLGLLLRDWRQGLVSGFLLAYFCGYSMLQFSRRHTFHLDIIPLIVVVIALDAVIRAFRRVVPGRISARHSTASDQSSWWPRARTGIVTIVVTIVVGAAILSGLRAWQQSHVTTLLDRTLAAGWESMTLPAEPLTDTNEPAYYAAPKMWSAATLMRVPPPAGSPSPGEGSEFLETTYWLAEVGGRSCGRSRVHLATAYSGSEHTAHREYARTFEVATSDEAPTLVLVPGFYQHGSSWTRFDGFATPNDETACLGTIKRVGSIANVRLPVLTAVLTPGWRERPLYQVLSAAVMDLPLHDPRNFVALPDPLTWTLAPSVERTTTFFGSVAFAGDATTSGYQTTSPVVQQRPGTRIVVRVDVRQQRGHVCVGALDAKAAKWVAPTTGTGLDFSFDVDESGGFMVAITNCNAVPNAAPSRFTVRRAQFAIESSPQAPRR